MQMKVRVIIFVRAAVFEPAALLHLNPKVFLLVCDFFFQNRSLLITLINLFRFSQQPFKSLTYFCFYLFKYPKYDQNHREEQPFPFFN